jgi:serine/threonine-protein kinase
MAPEQIQGAVVDARTDIYSLGIIMYEMLAGKVPFERPTSVNILMAHVGEPPPPMREVNPNMVCTPVFEDLVMRCIAKDPEERFRSMDELLQALKRAHGVSMTGQLAAVMGSGSYAPPPMRSSSRPGGGVVLATGPYTPAGTPRSVLESPYTPAPTPLLDDLDPPRRSRGWILVGVMLAAVLGGLLGMAAFRMQSQRMAEILDPRAAPPPPQPATTPSAIATTAPSASSPAPERIATIHVTSDPPGASVREDGAELCASTPCDVAFKGDAADPAKVHKLLVQKQGFRPEARNVKALDAALAVKMVKGGGFARPPPPAPSPKPTTTATATADPPQTVPSGFKENPFGP